jgi:hypothetical protein
MSWCEQVLANGIWKIRRQDRDSAWPNRSVHARGKVIIETWRQHYNEVRWSAFEPRLHAQRVVAQRQASAPSGNGPRRCVNMEPPRPRTGQMERVREAVSS